MKVFHCQKFINTEASQRTGYQMYFHYFATPVSFETGSAKALGGKAELIFLRDIDSFKWKLENHTANFKAGSKSRRLYDQYFEQVMLDVDMYRNMYKKRWFFSSTGLFLKFPVFSVLRFLSLTRSFLKFFKIFTLVS